MGFVVISFARAQKTLFALPDIFKKYFFLFLGLHLVNFSFNHSMIYFEELRMTSQDDNYIGYMLAIAFVGFFVQSGIKVIWTFTVCHCFQNKNSHQNIGEFIRSHLEQGIIESLRGFLKAVKWGFLLVIPGLIKAIRYQFINFIICTDPQYAAGKVDVLKKSEDLTKKHLLGLVILFLVFGLITVSTSSSYLFINKPLLVGFTETLSFVLFTFEITYMFYMFEDLQLKAQS